MDVFVRGFFHVNLGDDLFLYILAKRYPDHKFHVILNSEYSKIFRDQKNIIVHPYKKVRRVMDRILVKYKKDYYFEIEKNCDLNVVIGGSIFQEGTNDLLAYERLSQMPRFNPTYILGANFGPYISEEYRLLVEKYLTLSEDVCFRDEWSKNKFPDLTNVRFAPDIVLGIKNIVQGAKDTRKQVFISVIDCSKKDQSIKKCSNQYDDFIIKSILCYSELGYKVVMSSFCKMEGDEGAIERIQQKIPKSEKINLSVLYYTEDNWEEVIDTIRQSEKVIASRFHAMILGMVFRKHVLPIAYNNKFSQFLDNFGLSNYCLSVSDLENTNIEEVKYLLFDEIENVANKSKEHFTKLDDVLIEGKSLKVWKRIKTRNKLFN